MFGIEIPCISTEELEIWAPLFSDSLVRITVAYTLGYISRTCYLVTRLALTNEKDSCCSVLRQNAHIGFAINL